MTEFETSEEKKAELTQRIDQAKNNPISLDRHEELLLNQGRRREGYVELENLSDLRIALKIVKELYASSISDEWIEAQIEHEKSHIDKAIEIYGDDIDHSFGIQFFNDEDDHTSIVPMYRVARPDEIDDETFDKNTQEITKSVENFSEGDKKLLDG